jgi:hypothetical protein
LKAQKKITNEKKKKKKNRQFKDMRFTKHTLFQTVALHPYTPGYEILVGFEE